MKLYQYLSLLLFAQTTLSASIEYGYLLEAPYPPPLLFEEKDPCSLEDAIETVDDLAEFELGKPDSLKRHKQEFHRRLIAELESTEKYYELENIGGYLVRLKRKNTIHKDVKNTITFTFDQSLRRIYYACYGCDTLEEALYDHEELQSSIAKYYPLGIPLEQLRLAQYFKAMAYGYRPNFHDKIENLRQERLTIVTQNSDQESDLIKIGNNTVRIVREKKTQKPLALWKSGSDKFHGRVLLVALGAEKQLHGLESAKIEIGYVATWNELLAQALNFLYCGRFLTPTTARYGSSTLHAFHRNQGTLSHFVHECADEIDLFISSFEDSHVQHWGMMQYLMSAADAHRNNTLVDGKHLICIDFGRALPPPSINQMLLNFRNCAFDWPQMRLKFSPRDKKAFSRNLDQLFFEYVAGIEKYEEKRCVRPRILKSIEHLQRNLISLRLAAKKNLTPYQIYRLKYPPTDIEDHFSLVTLFQTLHGKDPYSDDVNDSQFRQTLGKSQIFKRAPFTKAWLGADDDVCLFEYLIENAINTIQNTSEQDLYSEIQLSWLIRASLIIPMKMVSFF